MMKKNSYCAVLFLLSLFLFVSAHAADLDLSIPGISAADTSSPGGWIKGLYTFSLLGAGMLAFGVIVYAGLEHTFGAGNPSKQGDARDRILQALLGLVLLLGAYIVLTTINPNLINLGLPGLKPVQTAPAGGSTPPGGTGNPSPQPPTPVASPRFQCPGKSACWTDASSCRATCDRECPTAPLGTCQ